jgi:hypothetical protein
MNGGSTEHEIFEGRSVGIVGFLGRACLLSAVMKQHEGFRRT